MFERNNDKPGSGRSIKAIAIATTAVLVTSLAIVGTVAAQSGQRFRDVPRTHYAYGPIEWAAVNGITQGCGDGRDFCPGDTLSRAQMVTFLKRYHDEFWDATSTPTTTTTTTLAPAPIRVRGSGSNFLYTADGSLVAGTYRGTLALSLRGRSGNHEGILEITRASVSVVDSDGITSVLHTVEIDLADYDDAATMRVATDKAPLTLTAPFSFRVGNNLNDIAPGPADIVVELTDRACVDDVDDMACDDSTVDANRRFNSTRHVTFIQWEVVLAPR